MNESTPPHLASTVPPPAEAVPSSFPSRHRKIVRWSLTVLGVLAGLLILAGIVLVQFDWNRAKPWINQKVSEVTGRHFAIEGDLSADWHWPQPREVGWQRWVPGVTVKAEDLVMDNPEGFMPPFEGSAKKSAPAPKDGRGQNTEAEALSGAMGRVGEATATVRMAPLLWQHLSIDTVGLVRPNVALARTADGANNWTFERKDGPKSGWTFDVNQFTVDRGLLVYADATRDIDLQARIDTTEPLATGPAPASTAQSASSAPSSATAKAEATASPASAAPPGVSDRSKTPSTADASATAGAASTPVPYGLRFELQGRFAKAKIKAEGRAGQVISLRDKVVNYPLQIDASAGSVALSAEGILANPGALSGIDFQVKLKGASMADLYDLTGLVLPNTPAFETRGRLTGSLKPEHAVWDYTDFRGKVGQSDLQGSLRYVSGKPRPKLSGTMTSNQLRLADLGPSIGGRQPDNAKGDNTQRNRNQRGKVLPDAKFAAERWSAMDMDIVFKGRHIIRPESLPLENVTTRAVMENAQLTLAPLTFGVAQGRIESEVKIDGRSAPLKAQIRGTVKGLQLSALFPKVELMKKSLGRLDGAVALESTGDSLGGLLGNGTGEMRLYVREGVLSKQLLDLAALNIGSIVVGKLFGDDKEVRLRCAVADFTVVDGLATARVVKMSTDDAVVEATGTIDLGTEVLNLRIKPESLEWKFFSLRSPLYVRGTFGNPDVGVEVGPLLLRAGAAVAAAVIAPAALALVPVTVPAGDDDTHCKPLLDLAREPVKPGAEGAAGTASKPARRAARKAAPAQ